MTFNHFLGTFLPERLEFNKLWPPTTGGGTGRQFFINTLQISGQVSPIQADRAAQKTGAVYDSGPAGVGFDGETEPDRSGFEMN